MIWLCEVFDDNDHEYTCSNDPLNNPYKRWSDYVKYLITMIMNIQVAMIP